MEADNTGQWGDLLVHEFDELVSNVVDTGGTRLKYLRISYDNYSAGSGTPGRILWRGQATPFSQNAVAPAWEVYTNAENKNWRFVQIRVDA